jgi:hypothetical protein
LSCLGASRALVFPKSEGVCKYGLYEPGSRPGGIEVRVLTDVRSSRRRRRIKALNKMVWKNTKFAFPLPRSIQDAHMVMNPIRK